MQRTPTRYEPFIISLPIADRKRSYAFYGDALGLSATGPVAEDGVPEPLLFVLNPATQLMLVPRGGFGWVIGDHQLASVGTSECLLGITLQSEPAVDQLIERVRAAGARVVTEPAKQPWGYASVFADPDGHLWSVTCTEEFEA